MIKSKLDGTILSFEAPCLYIADRPSCIPKIEKAIAWINSRVAFVRYKIDLNDGEIVASFALPIEDGKLGAGQFEVCYKALIYSVEALDYTMRTAIGEGELVLRLDGPDDRAEIEQNRNVCRQLH